MIYREHALASLSFIFAKVNEIGFPRKEVKDIQDFMRRAISRYHTSGIYADVFENWIEHKKEKDIYHPIKINKLYFDFDFEKDTRVADVEIHKTMDQLADRGVSRKDMLKVWSFGKGGHLYVKIKPILDFENNKTINHQVKIKSLQYGVSQCDCGEHPHLLHSADTQVMADSSRISRVLGIQRYDNKKFPVAVSNKLGIKEWISEHSGWDDLIDSGTAILHKWGGNGTKSIDDIIHDDDQKFFIQNNKDISTKDYDLTPIFEKPEGDFTIHLTDIFKKSGISDKMIERILDSHADNNDRITVAGHLAEHGYNAEIITNLFSMIGWYNWDYYTTINHVTNIVRWIKNKTTENI